MINLKANNRQEELILAYLQENASDTLTNKINNGTTIEKDGKKLINKKTLGGFMKYACNEARKLAEKGASSACVEDNVVYGWAIHYFEEESIEETLYNLDGTKYKTPKKAVKTPLPQPVTMSAPKIEPPKPTPPKEKQYSLFDLLNEDTEQNSVEDHQPIDNIENNAIVEDNNDEEYEDMDDGKKVAIEPVEVEKEIPKPKQTVSPLYQKYLDLQKEHPNTVIVMHIGDFYEAFGNDAVKLAENLNLTLTSRNVGLEKRLPMVGFPYHTAEVYFNKIRNTDSVVVWKKTWEKEEEITVLSKINEQPELEEDYTPTDKELDDILREISENEDTKEKANDSSKIKIDNETGEIIESINGKCNTSESYDASATIKFSNIFNGKFKLR